MTCTNLYMNTSEFMDILRLQRKQLSRKCRGGPRSSAKSLVSAPAFLHLLPQHVIMKSRGKGQGDDGSTLSTFPLPAAAAAAATAAAASTEEEEDEEKEEEEEGEHGSSSSEMSTTKLDEEKIEEEREEAASMVMERVMLQRLLCLVLFLL